MLNPPGFKDKEIFK
jgi:hypothetical protein